MCVTNEDKNTGRARAIGNLKEVKLRDKGKKFIHLPHPSGMRGTWILKEVK